MAEELRADYESLFTSHEEMKGRLSLAEQQLAERDEHATLQDELEAVKAQLSQLQTELMEVALSRDKALSECGSLRSKEDEQRSTIDALNNQLDRSVEILSLAFFVKLYSNTACYPGSRVLILPGW